MAQNVQKFFSRVRSKSPKFQISSKVSQIAPGVFVARQEQHEEEQEPPRPSSSYNVVQPRKAAMELPRKILPQIFQRLKTAPSERPTPPLDVFLYNNYVYIPKQHDQNREPETQQVPRYNVIRTRTSPNIVKTSYVPEYEYHGRKVEITHLQPSKLPKFLYTIKYEDKDS